MTQVKNKERKTDRVLLLKAKEGAKSSTGLVDTRLFKGNNNLHVIQDDRGIWTFKYDEGAVPPILKNQSFTTFDLALKHAKNYFTTRNVEIIGIDD